MAIIPLTKSRSAIVDDDDLEMLSRHSWSFDLRRGGDYGYAYTSIANKKVYMHRLLMGSNPGMVIDHANRNSLDNRRCNLRWAKHFQNVVNRDTKIGRHGFRGVLHDKGRDQYRAVIGCLKSGTRARGPRRKTPIEAARDYDALARERYGEFAPCNFPN